MRLWTLHPRYLDSKGLVAVWREALLAQKVLQGGTRGYTRHPQLDRFRAHKRPVQAIAAFLAGIAEEAELRGYHFDTSKISPRQVRIQMKETRGQLLHEWKHLQAKLRLRSPALYGQASQSDGAGPASPVPHRSRPYSGLGTNKITENEGLQRGGLKYIVTILFGRCRNGGR